MEQAENTEAPAPEAITEAPAEQPKPSDGREPFMLWVVDMPWPGEDDNAFDADIPQPAAFQRAYRADVYANGRTSGRRKTMLRLVWMVRAGGQPARITYLLQREGRVYRVPLDGSGARLRATVVAINGDPIALWELPLETTEQTPPADPQPPAPEGE